MAEQTGQEYSKWEIILKLLVIEQSGHHDHIAEVSMEVAPSEYAAAFFSPHLKEISEDMSTGVCYILITHCLDFKRICKQSKPSS